MKIGVSIIFLLLIFTTSISFIDFTTKNNVVDKDSLSISAPEDGYEPNDYYWQAYDISSFEGIWLSSINGTGTQADDDFYEIYMFPGFEILKVNLTYTYTLGDIDITICDNIGTPINGSGTATDNEHIDFKVPYSGTFYIHVWGSNASNSYDLWWVSLPPPPPPPMGDDPYEPNNHIGEAWPIIPNYYWDLKIVGFNEDWFRLDNLNFGDVLDIDIFFNHSDGDLELELYDPYDISSMGSYSITDDESITFTTDNPGNWSIRVYQSGTNANVSYDLDIWVNAGSPIDDSYEENDDWSIATDLTSYEGWWLSDINGSGLQWDDDWYIININPGSEHLRINLIFDHFMGDIDFQLHDSSFSWSVSRTSTTNDEFMDITVPWSGIYYIQVYLGNMGNSYNLQFYTTTDPDDSYEENDQEYETSDLTSEAANWQYSLRQFDDDWYEIYVDPGEERLKVELIFNHFAGNIDLEIYDWNYNYIDSRTSWDDNEFLEIDLTQGGTYYLRVFGDNMGNYYDLWWEDLSPFGGRDDWAEENDDFWNARWVDAEHYSDLKIVDWDEDWFQIYLNYGDLIEVEINFADWEGNLDLGLYDPSNFPKEESNFGFDHEFISFTADISGDWRVQVHQESGSNYVKYDLNIWLNGEMHGGGDDAYEFNNNADEFRNDKFYENGEDSLERISRRLNRRHPSNLAQYEQTWLSDLYGLAVQGDDDWYLIDVTPGFLNLEVKLLFNHSLGDIDMELHYLRLWDSNNNPIWNTNPIGIGSFSSDDNEYINHTVSRGGYYLIQVFGNSLPMTNGVLGNEYNLWWDDHRTRIRDDDFEINDDPSNAYDISAFDGIGFPGINQNDLGVQYNEDFYSLYVPTGFERLGVFIMYDFAEGVMGLEIWDHEFNKITENFTMSDNEYIDYIVPSNGTYYIRVFGDNSGNTYILLWEAKANEVDAIPGFDLLIMIGSLIGISMVVIKMKRSKFRHQ